MSDYGVVTAPRTIRMERLLPGPIERVWSYLADPEKRATWLAAGSIDLKPGGAVRLTFNHESLSAEKAPPADYERCATNILEGSVVRIEKPRLLVLSWGRPPMSQTEVTFELTPEGQKVRLVLTHRLLPNRHELVGASGGWHAFLAILEDQLAGVAPRPFFSTHAALHSDYERRIAPDA